MDGERPVDTILSQNPGQGERAQRGSEISVVVVGTQVAEIPDVRGSLRDEAERELADAGFTAEVEEEESREQEGTVISQNPPAGARRWTRK